MVDLKILFDINRNMSKSVKTSFILSEKLHDQLKIMCVLTHTNMGNFIRIAIQETITKLKQESKDQKER